MVDALYLLPPSEFIGNRNDLAKVLRAEKRKDDAVRVAKLAKPTVAAWALNQIARLRPDLVHALITKGAQLRQVQDHVLNGQAEATVLLSAADERRNAIRFVVGAMSEALDPGDVRRTDEWVRTLEAASVDARLGELLRAGRFTTVVLEGVGFDGLLAGSDPAPRHLSVVPALPVTEAIRGEAAEVEEARLHSAAAEAEALQNLAAATEAEATRIAAAERAARLETAVRVETEAAGRVLAARHTHEHAAVTSREVEHAIAKEEEELARLGRDLAFLRLSETTAAHELDEAEMALEVARAAKHVAEAATQSHAALI